MTCDLQLTYERSVGVRSKQVWVQANWFCTTVKPESPSALHLRSMRWLNLTSSTTGVDKITDSENFNPTRGCIQTHTNNF